MGAFKHLLDLECLTLELMEIFWLFVLVGILCLLLRSCISRSALGCVGIKNCVKITHRQLVRLVSPHSSAGAHLATEHGGDIGTFANSSKSIVVLLVLWMAFINIISELVMENVCDETT